MSGEAAPVVFACGSTTYPGPYEREVRRLTLEGNIVLEVGLLAGVFAGEAQGDAPGESGGEPLTDEQRRVLDKLHLRKVDVAEEVRVVNRAGDLDEAARRGILRALATGVPLSFTDEPHPTYVACVRPGCHAEDVFGCGGHAAVRQALRAGWKSVPSVGWLCPDCGEHDPRARPAGKGDL